MDLETALLAVSVTLQKGREGIERALLRDGVAGVNERVQEDACTVEKELEYTVAVCHAVNACAIQLEAPQHSPTKIVHKQSGRHPLQELACKVLEEAEYIMAICTAVNAIRLE